MNTGSISPSSKRELFRTFYDIINQTAKPGDVVFFISETKKKRHSILSRLYRRWQGLAENDTTIWHTAILTDPKKEGKGSQWRPHIVHAIYKGTEEIYIPPSYFTCIREDPAGEAIQKGRIEIVQDHNLTECQRREIVKYARMQLGKPFAYLGWRHDILTYAFGLSPKKMDPRKVSCHGLAFLAYQEVGFSFPHQLKSVPFFNLARYLGYPLGQPRHKVDLRRLYLRDHHLYRDSRFDSVLAVFEDDHTKQIRAVHKPGKHF